MKVTLVRSRAIDPAINKVAKSLSQNGYDVKLLVWDRENRMRVKNGDGYTICRFGFKGPHDKSTVLFYLPIWWLYEFFFLLGDDSEVIHACDLDTLIPTIFIKVIKRIKLCYTIYDFYADNIPKKIPNMIKKLVASLEKFGIRFAEVLFLVDESRYEQVKGMQINNLVYIYNSPPDYFDAKQRQNSSAGAEIVILYAGVIHKSRGLEYMIRAVEDLDEIRLIIAGTGPDKDLLENQPPDIKKKIQYIGWIPYEEVIKKTLESDILFAFYDPNIPNNRYASPNKLFEAMMCGKPIIVNDNTSMANIVSKENCGLVVLYGDVNAIKDAILELTNDPDLREKLGGNGRKAYEEKYSWDIMGKRLIDAYKGLEKSMRLGIRS